jgi:hypothetical protein
MKKKLDAPAKLCIDNAPVVVKDHKLILVFNGQGEGDTKWKGWL